MFVKTNDNLPNINIKYFAFFFCCSGGCHIAYPNSVCMQLEKTSTYPCDANTDAIKLLQHAGRLCFIAEPSADLKVKFVQLNYCDGI